MSSLGISRPNLAGASERAKKIDEATPGPESSNAFKLEAKLG